MTGKKYDKFAVFLTPDIAFKRQVRAKKVTPFETARFLLETGFSAKGGCPH